MTQNPVSKTCVKRSLYKRPQNGFQDQLSLNAGQKYCRLVQGEHTVILSTFIISYHLSLRPLAVCRAHRGLPVGFLLLCYSALFTIESLSLISLFIS